MSRYQAPEVNKVTPKQQARLSGYLEGYLQKTAGPKSKVDAVATTTRKIDAVDDAKPSTPKKGGLFSMLKSLYSDYKGLKTKVNTSLGRSSRFRRVPVKWSQVSGVPKKMQGK
jgi:hypothetical protein